MSKLQRVWDELDAQKPPEAQSGLTIVDAVDGAPSWGLWELVRARLEPLAHHPDPVRGLYLYGGVGAGKTMLMDLFYEAVPRGVRKKRIHFHDFMLDVHRRLREHGSVADPLKCVAKAFTRAANTGGGVMVLCLDELMVHDVADAMLLKRLFLHLFDYGTVLVSTSNRPPDGLYKGGLQRQLFLPFIELLKERCEVHDIQGGQDYRMLAKKLAQKLYFTGPGASEELLHCLEVLSGGAREAPVSLDVAMGRTLLVPRAAAKVAYLPYSLALEQAVAAADYISLCERFHTVLVDQVPCFSASTRAACYRLVTLVDVAYERHVRLIFAAECSPEQLFRNVLSHDEFVARGKLSDEEASELVVDDTLGFVKQRTISRIVEMSTQHFAREHARLHAPELLPSLPSPEVMV